MKIGLLSDTHGYLDQRIFEYFNACDEVWHAGDVGDNNMIGELGTFKPLRAVYGNIDDKELQSLIPEDLRFTCEKVNVWITHIGGVPPNYNNRVKKLLGKNAPDLFVCGHSHILKIGRDASLQNMLFVNPGAAGHQGFHHMRTIVRFEISGKDVKNLEVIELGKRGALEA